MINSVRCYLLSLIVLVHHVLKLCGWIIFRDIAFSYSLDHKMLFNSVQCGFVPWLNYIQANHWSYHNHEARLVCVMILWLLCKLMMAIQLYSYCTVRNIYISIYEITDCIMIINIFWGVSLDSIRSSLTQIVDEPWFTTESCHIATDVNPGSMNPQKSCPPDWADQGGINLRLTCCIQPQSGCNQTRWDRPPGLRDAIR